MHSFYWNNESIIVVRSPVLANLYGRYLYLDRSHVRIVIWVTYCTVFHNSEFVSMWLRSPMHDCRNTVSNLDYCLVSAMRVYKIFIRKIAIIMLYRYLSSGNTPSRNNKLISCMVYVLHKEHALKLSKTNIWYCISENIQITIWLLSSAKWIKW